MLWLPLLVAAVFGLARPVQPTDFYVNLKLGEIALEAGAIPLRPMLAYAPMEPDAVNGAWLAQVVFALVFRAAGFAGLIVLQALLVTAAFVLLLAACVRRSERVLPAAVATLAALAVAHPTLNLRPQLFSVVLFALFLVLLSGPIGGRTLLILPAASAVWANLHGGFIVGLLAVGAVLAGGLCEAVLGQGQFRERLLRAGVPWRGALLVLVGTSACLNPFGPRVYEYVWRVGAHPVLRTYASEWQPPGIDDTVGLLFLGSLVVVGVALALGKPRVQASEVLLVVGFGLMTVQAQRNVVWWALAVAPLVAAGLARLRWAAWRPGPATRADLARRGAMAFIGLTLVAALLPWGRASNPLLPPQSQRLLSADTPVEATEQLVNLPGSGRLFNPMHWGGYLSWALWPRYQVFADNLIEAYPSQVWDDYFTISAAGQRWEALLESHGVEYAVLDHESQGRLIAAMEVSPNWRVLYDDGSAAIFGRAAARR